MASRWEGLLWGDSAISSQPRERNLSHCRHTRATTLMLSKNGPQKGGMLRRRYRLLPELVYTLTLSSATTTSLPVLSVGSLSLLLLFSCVYLLWSPVALRIILRDVCFRSLASTSTMVITLYSVLARLNTLHR